MRILLIVRAVFSLYSKSLFVGCSLSFRSFTIGCEQHRQYIEGLLALRPHRLRTARMLRSMEHVWFMTLDIEFYNDYPLFRKEA